MDDLLRQFLADQDTRCPHCGYDLRALTDDRCPECGEALVLSLRSAEPASPTWLVGLVALTFAAGFPLLVIALDVSSLAPFWAVPRFTPLWLVWTFVSLSIYVIWIFSRRWERHRNDGTRWTLALVAVAVAIASLKLNVDLVLSW